MEKLIEELNKQTNNEYKFTLKSATLTKAADFCMFEIFYKDGVMLSAEKKEELKKIILSIVPKEFKYDVSFIKNFISEERIENDFNDYMKNHFPSVFYNLNSVTKDGMVFYISLSVDNNSYEHAIQKNLKANVEKIFKEMYEDQEFNCSIVSNEVYVEDKEELLKQNYKEEDVDIFEKRKIEVSDMVPLVGENSSNIADYIVDKTYPEEGVIVCGKIKNIKPIVIKRKPKAKKEDSENEKNEADLIAENEGPEEDVEDSAPKYERKLYKFVLEDFTGEMSCVYFSNKETQAKAEKLDVGSVVIVKGNVEKDKFSGGVVLSVKELAYCTLPEKFVEYIEYRKEKPFYEWVKPERIVSYAQDNLMNFGMEKQVTESLKGRTFISFDFETTGLYYERGDKIVEIGAVKIEDGKITEKFECLINPEKHIPAEASAISGIFDEDVKDAIKDNQALQDFYKFTRGAVLTGYNIAGFDMRFLIGQGKSCRWNFDNEVIDTLDLAKKYVFGVKNYRLGTIAEKLGVPLERAHRAVYDAQATAEVFIILMEKADEIAKNNTQN